MCGKENDMKKLNVVRLGLLFAGCFLGAGYVSGQELRQYFVVYGVCGYVGLFVAIGYFMNILLRNTNATSKICCK